MRFHYRPVRGGIPFLWETISDTAVGPLDGSVYVTQGVVRDFNGAAARVSRLGADLGSAEYREHVGSVTVDPENGAVSITHMPRVDDVRAFIARMVLRKLDASLETEQLPVPFDSVVTVVGAAPAAASALEISLDVQPQDARNVVNLIPQHGQVRAALLSDAGFDALQVDLDSVRFGTAGTVVRAHWVGDVDRNGSPDLVVVFKTAETRIKCGDTAAPLTAETHDGRTRHGRAANEVRAMGRRRGYVGSGNDPRK